MSITQDRIKLTEPKDEAEKVCERGEGGREDLVGGKGGGEGGREEKGGGKEDVRCE